MTGGRSSRARFRQFGSGDACVRSWVASRGRHAARPAQTPFEGPFKVVFRFVGKEPFAKSPNYCRACYRWLTEKKGGAEVQISMLFADVRGSTPLVGRLGPANFAKVRRSESRASRDTGGAWVPVGVGVHTGDAYVGTVGTDVLEFTALGEEVTLAARLASAAGAGELMASDAVRQRVCGLPWSGVSSTLRE